MGYRNPELYNKLCELFGEVRVANEGEAFKCVKAPNVHGKLIAKKLESGEEYRVCCPICGDGRFRLYINHMFGLDAQAGFPTSKLVKCQNESCEQNLRSKENAIEVLQGMLKGYFRRSMTNQVETLRVKAEEVSLEPPLAFPSNAINVADLRKGNPAYDYLLSRRFSPLEIGAKYGVAYTMNFKETRGDKDYTWLSGRMFIPCGDAGWQARDLDGRSNIKYYSSPGWKKTKSVYNIESARKYPDFCVLTEGVTDVWRVGERGVATFGKDPSSHQLNELTRNFATVGVALDTDAFQGNKQSGQKAIVELHKRGVHAFRIILPEGKDPADCSQDELWAIISEEAKRRGLKVDG